MIGQGASLRRFRDPDRDALRKAARAAIVVPLVLAFADKVVGNPQVTVFAVFGSFALLVMADFRAAPRGRLIAYLTLAATGAGFITLGTLCSQNPWLGAGVMAVIALVVLSSSAVSPYFVMAGWAPLLTFVLPVALPADPSVIPDRLAGWALACGVGIPAAMLLWPPRPSSELREVAARACRELAALVSADLAGDQALVEERGASARSAVANARWAFESSAYRPTAATGASEALAFLFDEFDWFALVALPPAEERGSVPAPCADAERDVLAAVASVLEVSASVLAGEDGQPDLERLETTREAFVRSLARTIAERPAEQDNAVLVSSVEPSFRVREMCLAAREIGVNALRAAGRASPSPAPARARSAAGAFGTLALGHGSTRSVLLRNSVRGAAALAIAVYIAQRSGLQHSFWVVLGTLSVLRSSALGIGMSIVEALAGTAIGLFAGVGLVLAVGTHEGVLWAVFPIAVLLAGYAPQAVSFAAGQAGFTLTLLILFNLIQPTGWSVGLVRIEDVAIGFAVSLGVGLLFWPRGAASIVRWDLAATYSACADYVAAAVEQVVNGADSTRARVRARAAAHRLDDAFRQYLGELSGDRSKVEDLATLLAGATKLRLAANSLSMLPQLSDGAQNADSLESEGQRLRTWYDELADALVDSRPPPQPGDGDETARLRILAGAREAAANDGQHGARAALSLVWAAQQLDNLRRLERQLVAAVSTAAR